MVFAEPQRFRYATRIGFGLCVEGAGESVGNRTAEGQRTSVLKFWSDDPKSLIKEGSGYWKYIRKRVPPMASIYQRELGDTFDQLHPKIQERFGFRSTDGIAAIGVGIMDEIWHGRFYTLPFLHVGTWRRIMFPEFGKHVPFTIQNFAYVDGFGRETVTWVRTFQTTRQRRFDAYMIYSEERQRIVDYLGSHQHLAVDLELAVDANGGMRIRSGEQRFYEGPIAFRFPMLFSGRAEVCEWYDDKRKQYRIDVTVSNKIWGPLFGYHGSFNVHWLPIQPGRIPTALKPLRQEIRE